ncbi:MULTISPECIES: peptidylprolyl isomerase [Sulfurospirillum]|uniref:peptidylprolyl isomerase n=1 Tax=Sulfurospirillum TaxID=57665 RepID=UPI0005444C97|nr:MULTISPECIES: peptidylprolyl isomerase [Sulfurospirillum]KHG34334.1 MAG: peptidylprolyl isomerase [Sulfurospirillum sp. MES]MCP3650938.1 peptidylprolyl isomerase [Sulfurospirillum sp. DNRA8]MCR1809784.1 peptidylprolyl isomerase [Sulfurospirillum sp. DNRA8]
MITWMQRHKKYLVVTIWISTIAFVGAGFVGWGAYDLNKDRAASVAKVGHRSISVQEFQSAYANHFAMYNNLLGGKLTQEQAEQMGLDKIVMQNLINQALILNYADEIGLLATKEDVKERLVNTPNFQNNGTFSKELYYSILKANRINPSDYEKSLEKEILYAKLEKAFKLPATQKEIELFTSAFFMEDRLSVASVTLEPNEVNVNEEQIKTYWDAHKSNYLTKKSYLIDLITIASSDAKVDPKELEEFYAQEKHNYTHPDGKLMSFDEAKDALLKDFKLKGDKKTALETYLAFKKGETNATETKTIYDDDATFPVDKIQTAAKDEVLKPFIVDNRYVVVKVKEIKFPEPMPYELAKKEAAKNLLDELKSAALEKKAQARLDTFNGTDIGFVSRDSVKSIAGLSEAKSTEFLSHVFDNTAKKGYQVIDGKAIVYEILEQKLLNNDKAKQYVSMISENVAQAKQTDLNQNLIKKLATIYPIEQYYKGK